MAKALPSAQDLGVVTPQPSLAVASYKGATGMEDDAARGTIVAANEFGQVAQHLEKAQEKYDLLQAEDRFNQYQERLNQIAFDPNDGWSTAKGENAIKPEFNSKYSQRFDDERNKLLETLESPGAKQRFAQLSSAAALRNRAALYEHSAKERVAYGVKVTEDGINNVKDNIWRFKNDDARFEAEMQRARSLAEGLAREWSVGASEETVKRAVQGIESSLWTHRIEALVAAGDTRKAREVMGKASDYLTTADKAKLDSKIQPQLKAAETQNFVSGVVERMVAKDPNAPFPALAIDEVLRKEYGDDPQALQLARAEVAHRRGLVEIQQRENKAQNIGVVMAGLFEKNESLASVQRTPEYQNLPGEVKAQIVLQHASLMATRASQAQAMEGRELIRLQRNQAMLELQGAETMARFTGNPEAIKQMPVNSLIEMAPTIGWNNVQRLINYKNQLDDPKKLTAAKLTSQAFSGIVNEYLTEDQRKLLASSPKTDGGKTEKRDLLKRIEEANLTVNAMLQNKKVTTLEEATELARTELSKSLRLKETGWGPFGKPEQEVRPLIMPKLTPEDVKRLYVPIAEIPQEDVFKTIAALRKYKPGLKDMPDAKILSNPKYVKLIEASYGRLQGGVPREQVLNYLQTEKD